MYRKRWNVSAWDVALEIAGYWRPGPGEIRIYKDPTLGVQPWVMELTHPWYGANQAGWERVG